MGEFSYYGAMLLGQSMMYLNISEPSPSECLKSKSIIAANAPKAGPQYIGKRSKTV